MALGFVKVWSTPIAVSIGALLAVAALYAHDLRVPLGAFPPAAALLIRALSPFETLDPFELRTSTSFAALDRDTVQYEAVPLAFLNGIATAMALFNLLLFFMLRRKLQRPPRPSRRGYPADRGCARDRQHRERCVRGLGQRRRRSALCGQGRRPRPHARLTGA